MSKGTYVAYEDWALVLIPGTFDSIDNYILISAPAFDLSKYFPGDVHAVGATFQNLTPLRFRLIVYGILDNLH